MVAAILLSSGWIFENWIRSRTRKILFLISAFVMVVASLVMWLALYRMRKTIKSMPRLKGMCNVGRMVRHSLAYFIWVAAYIYFTACAIFNPDGAITSYGYASWFLLVLSAFASNVLFFLIVWHLGTKEHGSGAPHISKSRHLQTHSIDSLDASLRVIDDSAQTNN
jgi:hypothetical protein